MADIPHTPLSLIDRLKKGECSNELDVAIEVATFKPFEMWVAVRPNAAGTKLIFTADNGKEETFRAHDWSRHPQFAIDELRAAQ